MTRFRMAVTTTMAAAALALTACAPAEPKPAPTTPAPTPTATAETTGVAYREVDGRELLLDACLPAGAGPHPAVLLVHGGAFFEGTRADMSGACSTLASIGIAAFSVDYRLLPSTYPAPVDDVAAAAQWLRDPAQIARFDLDGTMAIFGSSAGAIVSLSAAAALAQEDAPVQAVVALSAAGDLRPGAAPLGEPGGALERVALAYLGCETPDPCEAAEAASAVTVAADLPPTLLVHGSRELIPFAQAEGLVAALQAAAVPHELITVEGDAHGVDLLTGDVPGRIADFLAAVHRDASSP